MKKRYDNRVHLLFTDTDSLMYEVETEDLYKEIMLGKYNRAEKNDGNFLLPHYEMFRPAPASETFDFSNYPSTHPFYNPEYQQNKAQVGLMKDETAGKPIYQFVGLRPKMYSFKAIEEVKEDGSVVFFEKHRAKGIQRVAAANFTHEQYLNQLQHPEENFVLNRRLGSKLHNIYGIEVIYFYNFLNWFLISLN